jgi:poly-gamma-glutamate synthesis protein (capsule biosynthesis protein)
VDQILPHPSAPEIFEPCVRDAREYVALAELASGPISRPVSPDYIWGDALEALARTAPYARIINLETSVTGSDEYWPDKSITYRMHPENIACLGVARIDVCVLANNHVLDNGYAGLEETLDTLVAAGIKTAGAGRDLAEARRPAIIDLPDSRRVLVFAFGIRSSGIPPAWGATPTARGSTIWRTSRARPPTRSSSASAASSVPATSPSHRSTGAAIGATRCPAVTSGSRIG